MRAGLVVWMVVLGACTDASPPAAPAAPPTKAEPAPLTKVEPSVEAKTGTPAAPRRWACAADADCIGSCTHGAVNAQWHRESYPGGEACEDGCTRKGTDPARCEAGRCVAYHQGARDPACTEVDVPVHPGPGPAHRCQADDDCTQTCALGAVNRQWLSGQADPPRCKDGCTAKGTDSPRCEAGQCVAYRLGRRDDSCTARPIPPG